VPLKHKEIGKLYFPIGEVTILLGVNASTLRFWETEFDVLKPHRNKKGNRFYTHEDVENLKLIKYLLKDKGYTIPGARDELKSKRKEVTKNMEIIESLNKIKEFLLKIKEDL
jgi:DNA-binding transcriptional MerR regulator